ncbi:MAG: hypothetical protein AAGG07_01615 [Planctomycetota bacterium]
MNRLLFALLAWIALGLEVGLRPALRLGTTGIAPSFVIPLAVFIAASAPPRTALWSCLALGIAVDLLGPAAGSSQVVLGPNALGYLLAAQLVLALRGVMVRRNPLSLAFLSVMAAATTGVVVVACYAARGLLIDPIGFAPAPELGTRLLAALYTAATGLFMALVLLPLAPTIGFGTERRFGSRR